MGAPPDRLPPLPPEQMSATQRAAAHAITAGPRGELVGPFIPLLRSPELMTRLQRTGEYLRFDSVIAAPLRELAILLVARRWNQQFEWAYHCPLAVQVGLPQDVIESVAAARRPDAAAEDITATWDLIDQLHRTGKVDNPTYAQALVQLGEVGVVEIVALVGYYTTLAMIMNVAQTPAPPHDGPPLPSGGHL